MRRSSVAPFLGLAALVLACCPGWAQDGERVLVVRGGTLFDGTGADPLKDAVVVIRGRRVVAVGARSEVRLPARIDEQVDAAGKWIIPGLVDAHVHFFQSGGLYTRPDVIDLRDRLAYAEELECIKDRLPYTFTRYLCSGVTSVVDVGGPMWNFHVRDLAAATDAAPRVAVAGPLISTYQPEKLTTPDPPIIRTDTPEDARRLVARQAQSRPDLAKIWYITGRGRTVEETLPMVRAAIEEAHARSIRVAVHATELETAKAAVRAGADVLVHSVFADRVDDEFVQMVKKRGVIYTPTLIVTEGYDEVLSQRVELTEFERRCGDAEVIATWDDLKEVPKERQPPRRARTRRTDNALSNLKRMAEGGAVIAAGTDAGNIGTLHGPALHREFELMAEAGLDPRQVLLAATRDAARVFSSKPQMGTIEAGKLADLVVLHADPLQDVRNLRKIHRVIKGGQVFDPARWQNQ